MGTGPRSGDATASTSPAVFAIVRVVRLLAGGPGGRLLLRLGGAAAVRTIQSAAGRLRDPVMAFRTLHGAVDRHAAAIIALHRPVLEIHRRIGPLTLAAIRRDAGDVNRGELRGFH